MPQIARKLTSPWLTNRIDIIKHSTEIADDEYPANRALNFCLAFLGSSSLKYQGFCRF